MASAMNHRKRSHRSERQHYRCLHSMKQFAPANDFGLVATMPVPAERPEKKLGPRRLMSGNMVSKHIGGWLRSAKKRNRKRAGGSEVPA